MAEVLPTDQDFRALIVKLKSLKPQRVGVFLFAEQLPTFMRQARESNANFEIFGAAVCETAATIDGAQKYLEGCVYPDNQVSEAFRERYRSRYHNEMQLTFAGAAYDMSTLLADYILSHPSASSSEMLTTLESVRERKGALGAFSFKDDPNFGKYYEYPIVMKKIINGVGTVVSK
jgi:ABC-type branched-subunit amino acid transport system substrate-binding protein